MDIYPAAAELIRDVRIAQPINGSNPHAKACAALRLGNYFPSKILMAVRAASSPALSSTHLNACSGAHRA